MAGCKSTLGEGRATPSAAGRGIRQKPLASAEAALPLCARHFP